MRIERLRLASRDPGALAEFYRLAFDARPLKGGVALGAEVVEIATALKPNGGDFLANETGFQHFAIVVADIDRAYRRLCDFGGWRPISRSGPERLPQSSGGAAAFKFQDFDGHPLELLQFSPNGVPAPWRARIDAAPNRLFYGIDHTALTVSDAHLSLAFYERVGFICTHRHVNAGAEQRRLDGLADVSEVRVEVLSLSPPDGARPGVELLAYRNPATISRQTENNSAAATTIVIDGGGPDALRDPDGHRLEILSPQTAA